MPGPRESCPAAPRLSTPPEPPPGRRVAALMFLFFSNRAGCGGSLLVTLIGTLILLYLMGWLG
jgi:hypothetical protein